MENERKKMTLTLDDGSTVVCNLIDIIELDSKSYIALVSENKDRVFMYQYVEDPSTKEFELLNITDKDIFAKVEDIFFNMIAKAEEEEEAEACSHHHN